VKIALVAEEVAGLRTLERVAASGHEVVMVLSSDRANLHAGPTVGAAARAMGIEVQNPARVSQSLFANELRARSIDVLLNVHSLFVIRPEVLGVPAVGAFNLHPGPLPEYAGLNTVSWALYESAVEYGATLHWMAPQIDGGPVAYQRRFPIDEGMTAARLMSRSVREGLQLVDQLLAALNAGGEVIPRMPQDLSRRRYYDSRVPLGGMIDWATQSARTIAAFVRACDYDPFPSPWGRPRARINGMAVEVTRAARTREPATAPPGTLGPATNARVVVAARDEWVELQELVIDGRRINGDQLSRWRASEAP
jgi:methionyl-tRNA formyltransferase